jgi:acyl carrier protein
MREQVIKIIANQIGVEPEDITEDDSLREELHMSSVDLAEITEKISQLGLDSIDWSEVETVAELLDSIGADL